MISIKMIGKEGFVSEGPGAWEVFQTVPVGMDGSLDRLCLCKRPQPPWKHIGVKEGLVRGTLLTLVIIEIEFIHLFLSEKSVPRGRTLGACGAVIGPDKKGFY